ncbi:MULTISPECIES: lipopolysaccharide assembly protein LapA domain-containing protein [unclassified Lysinibacillus]|uniref:LapA family protein n=1 Tax=unclassified Lysinibacillus TaxID=2636778 RepID=UPI00201301C9|nr:MULTISPECIES: lipopolysaccharide assembly protein LapA domain-containing protein [unclassified Lysinibacillus]MCL1697274.1 lipopolysaccharide assembly protein LapA domain-containing protein [Lysinibacillus sp. BPa_S21]MCL1701798.1 lipopolysaccharide assembly protein LapA domain-containing protein [Lysinibacillus sp. Bpr_S20]
MKRQWNLILAIIVVLIIAIFSVINVDQVTVNYLFGKAEWPLILVIIGSVLLGALLVGLISMMKIYQLQRALKKAGGEIDQHS